MNDTDIVELFFARSDRAVSETANKYGCYLHQIAYNILRCVEDSEEVVQDSYLHAWNSIPPQRPRVLKYYLSCITRNLSLNRLKFLGAKSRSAEFTEIVDELEDSICFAEDSAESQWEQKQLGELINQFLSTQGRTERGVFICRYYYAFTLKEIAEKLSIPEHKIRYMLLKMRAALKDCLKREGITV